MKNLAIWLKTRRTFLSELHGKSNFLEIKILDSIVWKNIWSALRREFKESRSKKIAMLMKNYLAREDSNLQLMTTLEVLEFIQFRFKKDSAEDVLIQSLIRLLSE